MRKLKLKPIEKKVLLKIKKKQVKNVERPIRIGGQRALDPKGKPLTAVYLNISNQEAAQFWKLHRKGLIKIRKGASRTAPAFTDFLITPKGKAQLSNPKAGFKERQKKKRNAEKTRRAMTALEKKASLRLMGSLPRSKKELKQLRIYVKSPVGEWLRKELGIPTKKGKR